MVWTVAGWSLIVIGAGITLWAWFGDQPRGRRRCRKCWYDMSSVNGLGCPECGRVHRHEGRLWKTRRHWGVAILGVVVASASFLVWRVPAFQRDGWRAVTPTWVMLCFFESLDDWGPGWTRALNDRIGGPGVTDWHRTLLVRRAIEVAGDDEASAADRDRAAWWIMASEDPNGSHLYNTVAPRVPAYSERVSSLSVDTDGAMQALASMLRSGDPALQSRAAHTLGSYYSSYGAPKPDGVPSMRLYPLLAATIADDDARASEAAASAMNMLARSNIVWTLAHGRDRLGEWTPMPESVGVWADPWPDNDAMIDRVAADIDHEDPRAIALALWVIAVMEPERLRESRVLELRNHESKLVKTAAAEAMNKATASGVTLLETEDIVSIVRAADDPQSINNAIGLASKLDPVPTPVVDQFIEWASFGTQNMQAVSARRWLQWWRTNEKLAPEDHDRVGEWLASGIPSPEEDE